MSNLRVGWIGTGVMGEAMAGHLLAAGFPLSVYNRTRGRAEGLIQKGALWASSPAELAATCEIIFTIVGFPEDVRAIYLSANGLCEALRPGQIVVDMTTSSPALAQEIARAAALKGGAALDAPVSGGHVGAQAARLSIMVGGGKEAFERAKPFFEKMGKTITYLGEAGKGQHCKLFNQILIAGQMLALAEGLQYMQAAGLPTAPALEAVGQGAAASWSLANLGPRILKNDFAAGFFVDHFVKDLALALAESRQMRVPMPMVALAEQMYVALQAQGHGRLGTQAIAKVYTVLRQQS